MEAFIQRPIIQISDLNKISLVKYSKETDDNAPEESIVIDTKKKTEEPTIKPNAREDLHNIIFIQALYILQTVPIGLLFSIPLILQSRKVSYVDQGLLSFASWPLTCKLLWAPILDSVYIKRLGRRKTWIVLIEISMSLFAFGSATYLNKILDIDTQRSRFDITMLTVLFSLLSLMSASHDIVMDGWAIELLLKKNVSWQATCNSIGFTVGAFVGNSVFLLLESAEFCNTYLRPVFKLPEQKRGFIDIRMFLMGYGSLLLICGVLVLIFKNETNLAKLNNKESSEEERVETIEKISLTDTYKCIWTLISKTSIQKLIFILVTIRIGSATENIIRLRLIDEGVSREVLTMLNLLLSPIFVLLPLAMSKYLHGQKPLSLVIKFYNFKLLCVVIYSFFIYSLPLFRNAKSQFPAYLYLIYLMINVLNASISFISYISISSFIAQITDKSIGGTYLTFLSLWGNLGNVIMRTIVLFLTGLLTIKSCYINPKSSVNKMLSADVINSLLFTSLNNDCSTDEKSRSCKNIGGKCEINFDAFFLLTFAFVTLGFLWFVFFRGLLEKLQNKPKSSWLVTKIN